MHKWYLPDAEDRGRTSLMHYTEHSMIDFDCWWQSTLLNFTSHRRQNTHTGRLRWLSAYLPTSSVHCSRPSRSDGYSDRPPTQRLVRVATRTTAAYQEESEKIVLYSSLSSEANYVWLIDGGAHSKCHIIPNITRLRQQRDIHTYTQK